MKTYKDIVKTEQQLKESGYCIQNDIIRSIDVNIVGHFNNVTTLEMILDDCCLFSQYNIGSLFPFIMKAIVEILELTDDDGIRISKMKNLPVRIVIDGDGWGNVIGFGHFMKDEFILVEELIDTAKDNLKEAINKW